MFTSGELIAERANLHRFALRLTRNSGDAEDLVQSTLLRALEKKELFETGTSLFSWTSRIMFNLFATQYRRKRKFETQFDPSTYIERLSVGPRQEMAVDLARVGECLGQLTAGRRAILVMVCIRGMHYEEVAEALRVPVGTVRSRLSRARKQLQNLFEGGPALSPGSTSHIYQGAGSGLDDGAEDHFHAA